MFANVAYVYSMAIAQATQIVVGYLVGAGLLNQISKKVWATHGDLYRGIRKPHVFDVDEQRFYVWPFHNGSDGAGAWKNHTGN